MIGAHLSFGNPMSNTIYTAKELELDTFQMFTRNARSMKQRVIYQEEVNSFNSVLLQNGFSKFVVHAPYAMNPSSPDEYKRKGAIEIIKDDMRFLSMLAGNCYYVLHPGFHMGYGSLEALDLLSDSLHEVGRTSVPICVEMMSGKGTEMLFDIYSVVKLLEKVKDLNVRLTYDSCHVFANGSPLVATYKVLKEYIAVVHVNDSQYPERSYKDRHANIGRGYIPVDLMKELLFEVDKSVPIILETPEAGFLNDISFLKKFAI